MSGAFADRLTEATRAKASALCVGLDPFPERIPTLFGAKGSLAALEAFSLAILDAAQAHAPAVKPQLGLYEAYGPDGYALAARLCAEARARGLMVVLDAKRGDIGTTAEGYAAAAFTAFGADAVTVNPYMGLDSLEPFLARAEALGRGVAPLARTSNPGARDVQDLVSEGRPIWAHVAQLLRPAAERLQGAGPYSGLMPVVGATGPAEARAVREILPRALILTPGFGAQGASAADAAAALVAGPAGPEGGLAAASRAVLYPEAAQQAAALPAWRDAINMVMADVVAQLRAAGGAS